MKLIDIKNKKSEQSQIEQPVTSSSYEKYPWGLSIDLEREALEKLGLTVKDFKLGKKIMVTAEAEITSVSESESVENKKPSSSVRLQIQKLGLETGMKKSHMDRINDSKSLLNKMKGK